MRVLISGSSGFIGSALVPFLEAGGHRITRLVRSGGAGSITPRAPGISWQPVVGRIHAASLEGFEAVVHLAGENIGAGRWSAARKEKIRRSRVGGTRLLAEALASLSHPPRVMVSASAIGYYGDRGDELLTEESAAGSGFLSELCRDWEAAASPAVKRGIRVVNPRFGIVLSEVGGALARMLPPFRAGLGGVLGSGRQYMSWIAFEDVIGAISYALTTDSLRGPVNFVAPEPLRNRDFTKALGHVLRRPTLLPAPAFFLRLALGEMADSLLLASARVSCARLEASGYQFRYRHLEDTLRDLLGKTN